MTIFERIKQLADKQGKSLQKVSEDLGLSTNYIYNLKGAKSPAADKLALIADYFHVSVDYLLGREDDGDLELWEEATGYSVEQIKNEMKRMRLANHILGDKNDLQNVIGQAVENLSGTGETEEGIIEGAYQGITELWRDLSKRYEDPQKIENFKRKGERFAVIPANANIFYDDLSTETYEKIYDILTKARYELDRIKNECKQ